jgi:hypothetical protein
MTTFLAYIARLITISIGFSAAVLTAVTVVSLPLWAQPDGTETVLMVTAFAMGAVFLAAQLGSAAGFLVLLVLAVSEYLSWRDWLTYALAGGGVTGGTMLIIAGAQDVSGLALVTAAGLAGGIVYWLIAGRNAGKLFEKITANRSQ